MEMIQDLGRIYPNEKCIQKRHMATYKCDCGKIFQGDVFQINKGNTKSCGCARYEFIKNLNTKHGQSKSPLMQVWNAMKQRTSNPAVSNYRNYGGRGIVVCEAWKNSFIDFYNWSIKNGYQKGLQINRKDNDGNYEPLNCEFISSVGNNNNRRNICPKNTSGYCGVSIHKNTQKYIAIVYYNNKTHYVGIFSTAKEAAIERNKFILNNNFPKQVNIIPK